MKKIIFYLPAILLIMATSNAFSQKYKTAADSVNLNKEYLKVSNEIADLTADLTVAQNKLPGYQEKASDATSDAQNASIKTSGLASDAASGDVGDARKAKRKAKRAVSEAKDARKANNRAEDQTKKIAHLSEELAKKQARLQELDQMRTNINSTIQQ